MRLGYCRVSAHEQTMALQEDALAAANCDKIYRDVASGARASRLALDEMLGYSREGDTIVVWKLDRFGRSFREPPGWLRRLCTSR